MFNLENVQNVADCDLLLEESAKELSKYDFELTVLNRRLETQVERNENLAEDLQKAEARVASLALELSILTEGTNDHTTKLLEKESVEVRVKVLKHRATGNNKLASVEYAKDISVIEAQKQAEQAFVTAVESHKATLLVTS